MDPADADRLLTDTLGCSDRVTHSRLVGAIMKAYAVLLGRDPCLWECVGLLHDLDCDDTTDDRSRHGPAAADRLRDLLPAGALDAIASHDHRSPRRSDSELSCALRSADASACLLDALGQQPVLDLIEGFSGFSELRQMLSGKAYLADPIEVFVSQSGTDLMSLLRIAIDAGHGSETGQVA